MATPFHYASRVVLSQSDSNGVVYCFPSVRAGWWVRVAVPSDLYMVAAVSTALKAALAGIRLHHQSRVDRVRGVA